LSIVACHGKALASGAQASFDAAGGTIGRDAANTLVLPDDDGMVARRHAAVCARDDRWRLRNVSEHAAIALNGALLAPGMEARLQAGDIVNIGAYVLQAVSQTAMDDSRDAWNMPMHADSTDARPSAQPYSELAAFDRTMAVDAIEPVDGHHGGSTGLYDLLDTPVDPLALFGTPERTLFGSAGSGSGASGLFGELLAARPADAFDAPPVHAMHGHAIRDDVPEIGGHLRLRVAPAAGSGLAGSTDRASEDVAATVMADSPSRLRFDGWQANARGSHGFAMRAVAPGSAGHGLMRTAVRHGGPIEHARGAGVALPGGALGGEAPSAMEVLARSFLDGAGMTLAEAADAGLTPEFMRTLGAMVEVLRR
jgi:predicted component of type VI protein secretion system